MKCLSKFEPFATLIAIQEKKIETSRGKQIIEAKLRFMLQRILILKKLKIKILCKLRI
ncbi:hypothetical protein LGL55_21785 [Clostridium tagluense]|uniref:hypothetical protein n=1 Tax=Clostridium tagluense TaxID=360422 RepID=UPI001CF3EE42|nr:hypothetical protein [Clostridium tagluense]MCB2313758.1 hypothetical protein [Clostridium tagluense]MCB2318574.1 hypothetical protein [Clostridium tagluense]MCB2323420.1 hypothetical protein [Clostridium tagluense]MCB2328287.1 hypothetical protein [Clostridium tagluense]MCB2333056.1 hypothetical protein [Clostridium tagluense]